MEFKIILACDLNNGIGKSSTIPWKISDDMKFFRETTSSPTTSIENSKRNVVIMGRLTAETFTKCLPNRINIVITSKENYRESEGFVSHASLDEALKALTTRSDVNDVFVIGGSILCDEAITNRYCRGVYLNQIDHDYECDIVLSEKFMSTLRTNFKTEIQSDKSCLCKILNSNVNIKFEYLNYENHEEIAYLDLLDRIITTGQCRETRNAKSYPIFCEKLEFDLDDDSFPLLTTKKMFYRGIFEELLLFLRGETNTKILEDKNVMIWNKNTTKDFMEKYDKNLQEFDMGPMYGFQMRHFGAEYKGCHQDYTGQGIDQLKLVIDLLVKDPHSRRIIMTTFNPSQAEQGVLYPCHGLVIQFFVEKNDRISLQMYQRSADSVLGLPFNIASYALFLIIITNLVNNDHNRTHQNDYKPGRIVIILGDTHIYSDTKSDHILVAKEQISRKNKTHKFPKLIIKKKLNDIKDMENMTVDDIEIQHYISEPSLKAEMYE